MKRFKYSLLATAGVLILALVLTAVGPKRVMAALGYTPVRDVDNGARQPVQIVGALYRTDDTDGVVAIDYVVPADKRLVIETVSGQYIVGNNVGSMVIETTVNGINNDYYYPMEFDGGRTHYIGTHSTRVYADPGTHLRGLAIRRPGNTGTFNGTLSVSGYFINLP